MNVVWHSFADFVAMGGYGIYVWGSMGVVVAGLAIEVLALRARRQAIRRAIAQRHAGARR